MTQEEKFAALAKLVRELAERVADLHEANMLRDYRGEKTRSIAHRINMLILS